MPFISFEGPDGSGKTSQVEPLAELLREKGYVVFATREPGGTPIGEDVRKTLFNLNFKEMHPRTEILLFQASRAQLVAEEILPRLGRGEVVLCDRYMDSTLAYQGFGHETNIEELRNVVNFATGGLKPDLTLLFDVDAETGLRRRKQEGDWNRLDDYEVQFHRRVQVGYHTLAAEEPERWQRIDATQTKDAVQEDVHKIVLEFLGE
jgi:dTMP kinase